MRGDLGYQLSNMKQVQLDGDLGSPPPPALSHMKLVSGLPVLELLLLVLLRLAGSSASETEEC